MMQMHSAWPSQQNSKLTIQILAKNCEQVIRECLESIQSFDAIILIADLGSTDNTINICKEYKTTVIPYPNVNNYSEIRNNLIDISQTDWQLLIDPWEVFESNHEQLLEALEHSATAYRLYVVQSELLTKETRLWRKSSKKRFIRPAYESLDPETTDDIISCVIRSNPIPVDRLSILHDWKTQEPHHSDVDYYLAFSYLTSGKYDKFINAINNFMFRMTTPCAAHVLARYYYASVQLKIKHNFAEAIKHIVYCLSQVPTMAEFWCLLGDIFVRMKQFHRAVAFYDNALIFGSRRLTSDVYPVEISKYKEYPTRMLDFCRTMIQNIHAT